MPATIGLPLVNGMTMEFRNLCVGINIMMRYITVLFIMYKYFEHIQHNTTLLCYQCKYFTSRGGVQCDIERYMGKEGWQIRIAIGNMLHAARIMSTPGVKCCASSLSMVT